MKFQVIFTHDSEYQGYIAEVPELPGCVSQGKTLDEAITNIKDAIKGYLHVLEKHGKPYLCSSIGYCTSLTLKLL
ncbi:type II toxin-antitoxin system HicB family antitoxin [Sphaerospermopsis torques-reginae]|uniref:Type II toxin-antitoxin system HicB family antitoxin n=1 Tax=Sphaerospermopsis torques-reginae ITEP-024 TaxID=984208 RepID=A0ABX8X045_9CYAN|nr:type II toxin-antitoxin system HicB family antitoxin [Sphaerospermopsis torques-reginae]QYX32061.1 type II toxin-antitoxin system HicB family antitoxin [Sphaerospermopsis torques-reginae ITEP-024]